MKYCRLNSFKRDLDALPLEIQELVGKKFQLFQNDPGHPSLRVKKMKGHESVWEGHITTGCVFTFHYETDESGEQVVVFRRIGSHTIYRKP